MLDARRSGCVVLPHGSGRTVVRVLIVDDHPALRFALRVKIEQIDPKVEIVEAESRVQACARGGFPFDLILLDLGLPDCAPEDTLCALRDVLAAHPETPVLIVSASESRETIWAAVRMGAVGFFPKSYRHELLLDALTCALQRRLYLPEYEVRSPPPAATAPEVDAVRASDERLREALRTLSARQMEVALLVAANKPYKVIARELNIEEGTVKAHVTAVYRELKLPTRNRTALAILLERLRYESQRAVRTA
jgi:DNA-binding NarL/FixJ family response regulator